MNCYDLAVIGAGPAGLMAAFQAALSGVSVLLLEKRSRTGRKLLLSGSGSCNVSNSAGEEGYRRAYGLETPARRHLLNSVFRSFPPGFCHEFLRSRGVELETEDEGKIFPVSRRAGDVLSCLVKAAEEAGVHIVRNCAVERIESTYILHCKGGHSYRSSGLVLACGGKSWPKTGSNGDAYTLAASLGHTITPLTPALAPVYPLAYPYNALSGISTRAEIRIPMKRGKDLHLQDELLFTHRGLSGPLILNSSRYLSCEDEFFIAFLPLSAADLQERLSNPRRASGGRLLKSELKEYGLAGRLAEALISEAGIPPQTRLADLKKRERVRLISLLTSHPFRPDHLASWDEAMLTAGGVPLSEIRSADLSSRCSPGLFFAGEVMDIDGDEGGFNIQFALSSGLLAGQSAASFLLDH